MGLRRDASAEFRVDTDGNLGHERLDKQGVAHDADVRAEAAELDRGHFAAVGILVEEPGGERGGAKGALLEDLRVAGAANEVTGGGELPAWRPLDAVGDGEVLALLCFEVVVAVGVIGEDDGSLERAGVLCDIVHDRRRLGRAEGAVHEVILHVDDEQVVASHCISYR